MILRDLNKSSKRKKIKTNATCSVLQIFLKAIAKNMIFSQKIALFYLSIGS